MKLKRLILQGYKTFASKTDFIFDDGITAVVGPNGSGKSNIADAVRWVLGEQSYSTLRGKRTADMIFAGSQSRPRAGMAQAILTLDNSEGWLPIDYTEVEIGRRAYRSGENEYLLNGQKVRLKDVTDLLATSGLAERTYNIIGQGLVDQALSLRAEERRALFEEAAGINHYKSRRAETLRRLQETQRNLQRVHDILAEIRPRLTSLKRQATRAQNYEQLAVDLHNLLRIWYGYRWEQSKIEMRQARTAAQTAESNWQQSRRKLRVQQENMDDIRRQINRLQTRISETQDARDGLRDQLEKARRDAAILQERRQALARQMEGISQEFPILTGQQETAAAELETAVAELTAAQEQLATAQAQLRRFNSDFRAQQAAINQWQQALQTATTRLRSAQTRLAQSQGQHSQLQERLKEQQEAEQPDFSAELSRWEAESGRFTAHLEEIKTNLELQQTQRQALQEQRQALIRELKQLRRERHDTEQQLNQQRSKLARLEARVEMLDQMRLKETPLPPGTNLIGSLAGMITIPTAHRTALEAALQTRLATLLFADEEAMWAALDAAEEGALAAAALSRLAAPEPSTVPQDTAVIGWAANILQIDRQEAVPLVRLLLGRTLLVKDRPAAYRLAQQLPSGAAAVAPDGFIAHSNGLVESGAPPESSILAREEAWRSAQQERDREKETLAKVEETLSGQDQIIQQKQDEVDALAQQERELGEQERETRQAQAQAQRELDRTQQRQTFLQQQQQAQQKERIRLESRLEALQTELVQQQTAVQDAETAVSEAQAQLDALPVTEAQQQRESLQQAINAAQTIVAGRQAVVDSRRATLNQLAGQLTRLRERKAALSQQQDELEQSDMEDRRIQLHDEMTALDARLEPLKAELKEARRRLGELEDETAVFNKQTHDAETIYTQARINLNQIKNDAESLQERIKADLGVVALRYDDDQFGPTPLPISGVEELPTVQELPDDIEETIQSYRGQMQRMGAINPDAPAEYEETQQRHDFLSSQIEDLEATEIQLRQVIAELDDLTSRAFAETVDKVNDVFGGIFTQLFGGGSARLVLTDPDDLTISGVDIIARLPNRREQGLALLSGGERSLTAAALIFSLLKVSPTPFCIMDEVDAALDEANINRFRELLRELSLKTQFVIITHNRGTVQAAQTIYGISMGSDSASQAISIKPEDYVKQRELV